MKDRAAIPQTLPRETEITSSPAHLRRETDEPADPNRPNNLWEPVPGDHGAHGVFDDRASDHSLQLWANTYRGLLALVGLGLVGAAYAVFSRNGL